MAVCIFGSGLLRAAPFASWSTGLRPRSRSITKRTATFRASWHRRTQEVATASDSTTIGKRIRIRHRALNPMGRTAARWWSIPPPIDGTMRRGRASAFAARSSTRCISVRSPRTERTSPRSKDWRRSASSASPYSRSCPFTSFPGGSAGATTASISGRRHTSTASPMISAGGDQLRREECARRARVLRRECRVLDR